MSDPADTIDITLKVWRQGAAAERGRLETIEARNISVHMSFLEMLDVVNRPEVKDAIQKRNFTVLRQHMLELVNRISDRPVEKVYYEHFFFN